MKGGLPIHYTGLAVENGSSRSARSISLSPEIERL